MKPPFAFDNSYAQLPPQFYSRQLPTHVKAPDMIRVNHALAESLGVNSQWLESNEGIQTLAGNHAPEGADPIATVYGGHQFGGWNPQLGDGRAILLGEVLGQDGNRYDIQLKGAGQTAYSRNGDGRAPLGPVLREYIVSEAMAALGVPTTRSLAAVTTGETVVRDSFQPGAVLTRVASSHIRIGTFQYFAARQDIESLQALVMHATERHYSEVLQPDALHAENPVLAFLEAVIANQATLIAQWQLVGFIHGVMNTDNMLICGETVDYGPCAFMDTYNPKTVYSSIDRNGRYAYGNQPGIAHWNLSWLAQGLIPLLDENEEKAVTMAQEALDQFPAKYQTAYDEGMLRKLGLVAQSAENKALINPLFELMEKESVDFTLCFRKLADIALPETDSESRSCIGELFDFPNSFKPWIDQWQQCLVTESDDLTNSQALMSSVNPAFIPRNHLIQEVIDAAVSENDFQPFHQLVDLLTNPYEFLPEMEVYARPPKPEQIVYQTFCGT